MKTFTFSRVRSAFALRPHRLSMLRCTAMLAATVAGMLGAPTALATTYTWDGGNAAGDWSLGGAGGNWSGAAAPASNTANALIFQSNTNAQVSNNNIGASFDVDMLTFNVAGMTVGGSSIRFSTATAIKMTFGTNGATFNNPLELAVNTTLSTTTANPIVFNGQLLGPGTLSYVNAGTNAGTLLRFASNTANTINGFTLGNAAAGKGKATVEIGMNDPFGGAGTTVFLNNSGGVTFKAIGANRVVASGLSYRDNVTVSGAYDLTFQGNGSVNNTTARIIKNELDHGKTLTLGDTSSIWDVLGTTFNVLNAGATGVTHGIVRDAAISGGPTVNADNQGFKKTGAGTWRLTGPNIYVGLTKVIAGTLEFTSVENQGSPNASALGKPASGNETILLGNTSLTAAGTLKYVGTAPAGHSTNRPLDLAATTFGGTLDASGTGPISFLGGVSATGLGDKTLTLTGTHTGDNTLGGDLVDSTGFTTSLVKENTGKWILTGTKSYTGTTTLKAGTLLVNGTIGTTATTVKDTATLGGSGTLTGALTVESGGTVAPGASVGTLSNNLTGSKAATFATGAKLAMELGAPGTSDALAFTGLSADTVGVSFNNNVIHFTNAGGWAAGTYTLCTFDANNAYTGTLAIGTGLEGFDPSTHLIYNTNSIQLLVVASTTQATVTIAKTTDANEEGPVNGLFTVTRDAVGITNPLTLFYSTAGSSASAGSDYSALSGSVVILANQTTATIAVPVLQDNDFTEGTESVMATLTADAAYIIGTPNSATVDIADGLMPVVTLASNANGAEAGPSNASFTVSRPAGESSNYALSVHYTVDASSTATAGSDYTALSGSVVILANQNSATITVPVMQDIDFSEGNESVILNLSINAAYSIGGTGTATVDIADGIKPMVTLASTTQGAEAGPVNGVFTVTRSTDNGTGTPLTVYYTTNPSSTASAGSDYTPLSGSVVIGAGLTSAPITIAVQQDGDFLEGTETLILDLSTDAAYTVGTPQSASLDITDGLKPEVTVMTTTHGNENGLVNGVFTVSRNAGSASSGPVTVHYTLDPSSTATAGSDYTALSGSVFIPLNATSATITVPVLHDYDFSENPPESVILMLTPNAAYTLGSPNTATATITDISDAPVLGVPHAFTSTYPFTDTVAGTVIDPTPPPYENAIQFGAFSMVGGTKIGVNGMPSRFYANDWDVSTAINTAAYFQVTITPIASAGRIAKMTLNTITFDVARANSGGNGPLHYAVRSSLDNYASNLSTFTIDPANANLNTPDSTSVLIGGTDFGLGVWQSGAKLTLDSSFANLSSAAINPSVTFRIYGWNNAEGKDGGIDNFTVSGSWVVTGTGGYASWAETTYHLSGPNAAFDFDNDNDGLDNGLEYVLGGDPTLNDATSIMPSGTKGNNHYVFTYKRTDDSETDTQQIVQYGNDLDGWTNVIIDSTDGTSGGATYTVNEGSPSSNPDTIEVSIPHLNANQFFARLKVLKP